jgi:hypothetical protein
MTRTRALRDEQGVALVFMLIMLSVMTMLGLGITGVGMVATTVTVNSSETAGALAIADAGVAHARRLIMWQEWMSLTPFLQGGDGVACTGDEVAAAPPMPVPAGYPALATDFIPAAGRAFGGGTYQVFICDDTLTDVDPATGILDANPNVDVNKRIIVRSVGVGANGATSTVEQIYGAEDIPAVIVNGNVLAQGNVQFTGAAGAIHGNGAMEVSGNPCAQQYFSAAGAVTVGGGSAGGGAGCTAAALDTRPDSPPINVPILNPDTYKAQADYWMENNGTCYLGATGAAIACPAGWSYNAGATLWSGNSAILPGTYWFNSNVRMTGSPGTPAVPLPLTVLAKGYVDVSGSPKTTPDLLIPGLGVNPVGVSIMAGTDIQLSGSPSQTFLGLFYAWHQIDIVGTPTINGQVMAANAADTPYPVGAAAANNLVQLNAAGQMVLSGNATINFAGNGVQSVRAQAWRECRTSANPADPCGPLFGG